MSSDAAQIQIEQRVPRCGRCGKMINLRGHHLELVAADGTTTLVCSEICQTELAAIQQQPLTDQPGSTQ